MPKTGERRTVRPRVARREQANGLRSIPASAVPQDRTPAPVQTTVHTLASFEIETGTNREARVWVGDCRELIPRIPECAAGVVDMIFADPPFNWKRAYDKWDDNMSDPEYLAFTYQWLDLCIAALRRGGVFWVNIPDDWAAEIVVHLKSRGLSMVNWCIWHYRFGQNTKRRFINSKVHVLMFAKGGGTHTWNPTEVLEVSDRRSTYGDIRTESKRDGMPPGLRLPMDVWYGPFWGRIQGNNFERRANHDNQLPETYLERVIRSTSNEGDLVMDPFLGSGTTGVVAHVLKRRFIGIEYSADNALSAFERMKEGPVRPLTGKPQVTAIFEKRRALDNAANGSAPEVTPARTKRRPPIDLPFRNGHPPNTVKPGSSRQWP